MRRSNRFAVLLFLLALFVAPSFCQQQTTRTAPVTLQEVDAVASANETTSAKRPPFVPSAFKTFAEWKAACDRLPLNRELRRGIAPRELLPIKSFRQFDEAMEEKFEDWRIKVVNMTVKK